MCIFDQTSRANSLITHQEMIIKDKTIALHNFEMLSAYLVVVKWFDYFRTKLRIRTA